MNTVLIFKLLVNELASLDVDDDARIYLPAQGFTLPLSIIRKMVDLPGEKMNTLNDEDFSTELASQLGFTIASVDGTPDEDNIIVIQ